MINGFKACGLCPFNPDSINYSKCLGKNTSQREISKEISDTATITFETFRNVIGVSLCKRFQEESLSTIEPHLAIIYNLWKEFQSKTQNVADEIDTSCKQLGNPNLTSSMSPNITDNTAIPTTDLSADSCNRIEVLHEEQVVHQVEVPPTKINCLPGTSKTDQSSYYLHSLPGTSKSGPNICILYDHSQNQSSQSESVTPTTQTVLESPKLLKIKSLFGEYLAYPKTPIRKGKRQIERQPFAITSDKFKLALQKKQSEKENQLKEKEKKKMEREAKKTENSKKEQSKGKTKITKLQVTKREPEAITNVEGNANIFPESKKINILEEVHIKSNDVCAVCKHIIIKHKIECSGCHLSFHVRCVPNSHKNNIPDDADMMLFLCHFCYKVNDSDDDNYSDCEELYLNVQKARRDLNL